ncbi:MAG: hypothetical protein KDD25_03020 [Bdellovibrionales bacterium]|nr:hypothetical protein [Bdellovibrionales bacterium]
MSVESWNGFLQSKYFRPSLTTAIFDGPVRFYFADFQEEMALKVYASLRSQNVEVWDRPVQRTQILYVVQYPTAEEARAAGISESGIERVELPEGVVLAFTAGNVDSNLDPIRFISSQFDSTAKEDLQSI